MTQAAAASGIYPLAGTPTTLYAGQAPYDGSAGRVYHLAPDSIAVRSRLSADQAAAEPWTTDSTPDLIRESARNT